MWSPSQAASGESILNRIHIQTLEEIIGVGGCDSCVQLQEDPVGVLLYNRIQVSARNDLVNGLAIGSYGNPIVNKHNLEKPRGPLF